jgi:integrase
MTLTARQVATETRRGMHADGRNLYLLIGPTGARSWIFRYQIRGKRRDMGLGPVEFVSLAEARDKAYQLRRGLRLEGIDPIEEKRAAKPQPVRLITFAEVAERYVEKFSATWSNAKHSYQWRQTLGSYINPVIGKMAVADVDTAAILEALNPIWLSKAETASRCRGRIESILNFATSNKMREGDNPARWRGHLENVLPKRSSVASARVVHYSALPYDQLQDFMTALRSREGVAAAALEFAILTCARTGETLGARWSEIDLERRLWVVPAERMKMRREHRVPISVAALAVLERMAKVKKSAFVFPGQNPGAPLSNMALLMLLRKMGRGDLTAHGFRSTFRDWAAESTSFPSEVCELALAHTVGDKVEQAYRRGDLFEKRRHLAESWANFCDSSPPSDVVRHLRSASA